MKLKELLEKHQDLELTEEQEKEIKKFLNIKDNKRWKAEGNEEYWYINSCGDVDTDECCNITAFVDEYRYFLNNMFKTKEEAEFRLEQIKVYNELKNFADENNDEIDWRDPTQAKWLLYLSCENMKVSPAVWYSVDFLGTICFSKKELALLAIEIVGEDRIKKYLFNIKEENK